MKNFKNIFLLLIFFSSLLFSQLEPHDTYTDDEEEYIPPKHTCYIFNKEDFQQTLETPQDIFLMMFDLESGPEAMNFSLTTDQKVSYNSYSSFDCSTSTEKKSECTTEKSIEKLALYKKDDNMYLHVDYLQLYQDLEPVIHTVKSKNKTFSKGVQTPCFVSSNASIFIEDVKKGSKKDQLLKSIDVKDVSIYDLAYLDDLVIAVGEDSSPQTQEYQSQDEYHKSILLISNNSGKNWTRIEGEEDSIPNDKILIYDAKNIVISASMEGAGGTLLHSGDAGKTWKETYGGGMINSLKKVGDEIIATDIVETIISSKDGGATWTETPKEDEDEEENTEDSQKAKVETLKNPDNLAVLNTPGYYMDYEKNSITLRHSKENCHCDEFSLPLTYQQNNTKKGLLGSYWSLGIESHITAKDKNTLLLYDAYNGKESRYIKDNSTKNTFRYNGRSIIKTENGYSLECSKSKQYFNTDGYLIKISYPKNSYSIHYKDNKIDTVKEHKNGKSSPYLSFSYPYEGVLLTYEYTKKKRTITFLKNKNGLLSNILEGKHHFYEYLYDEPAEKIAKLSEVIDVQRSYLESTIFDFAYPSDTKTMVYDYTKRGEGTTKERNYFFFSKDRGHVCMLNTVEKTYSNDELDHVYTNTNVYEFTYTDNSRENLAFSKFENETYGFDENTRVNFYSKWDRNISLTYNSFAKISRSTVSNGDSIGEYTYTYTKDAAHNLSTIKSPNGLLKLFYNDKGEIKEMIIGKSHMYYEYNNVGKPIRIIIKDKGEVLTSYETNGDIKNVKAITYNDKISNFAIAQEVTQAFQLLLERVSKGSIKNYPRWVR